MNDAGGGQITKITSLDRSLYVQPWQELIYTKTEAIGESHTPIGATNERALVGNSGSMFQLPKCPILSFYEMFSRKALYYDAASHVKPTDLIEYIFSKIFLYVSLHNANVHRQYTFFTRVLA